MHAHGGDWCSAGNCPEGIMTSRIQIKGSKSTHARDSGDLTAFAVHFLLLVYMCLHVLEDNYRPSGPN